MGKFSIQFQNRFADLHWIIGSDFCAARKRSGFHWAIIRKNSEKTSAVSRKKNPVWFPGRNLVLGINYQLRRPWKELHKDPTIIGSPNVARIPSPPLPLAISLLGIFFFVLLGVSGIFLAERPDALFGKPLESMAEYLVLTVLTLLCYSLFFFWEAGLLSNVLHSSAYILGFGWTGPVVEPVCWKLGRFGREALLAILFPVAILFAAWSWLSVLGVLSLGMILGSWLYLVFALYPLREGPGSKLLESLSGTENLPDLLKWSLAGRFLPAGQGVRSGKSFIMVTMVLATMVWVWVTGSSFQTFSEGITAQSTPLKPIALREKSGDDPATLLSFSVKSNMKLLNESIQKNLGGSKNRDVGDMISILLSFSFNLLGFLFCVWLLFSLCWIFLSAWRLRGKGQPTSIEPTLDDIETWVSGSALLRHVPEFLGVRWKWKLVPAGTLLLRQGWTSGRFFWFTSGEAMQLGRTKNDDLYLQNHLQEGAGVGERDLLEDRISDCDVLVTSNAIVASLNKESFVSVDNPELREKFLSVLTTSQVLDHSGVFQGMPPSRKEQWITNGTPQHFDAGTTIIPKGSNEKWMGVVVSGGVEVERDDQVVARLKVGDVFGDTSFLQEAPRSVNIRANEDCLIWKWKASWVEKSVDGLGLKETIRSNWKNRS